MLKATYDMEKEKAYHGMGVAAAEWLRRISSRLGHNLTALVEQDEASLIRNGLITDRVHADRSGIQDPNRFTDLGFRFCETLVRYGETGTGVSANQ